MALNATTIKAGAGFAVSVTVHNGGARDAQEVVQVYLTDLVSSAVTPNTALAGFAKVSVPCVPLPPSSCMSTRC
jgi:beta-glucosidase